jgi:hypothetical protein
MLLRRCLPLAAAALLPASLPAGATSAAPAARTTSALAVPVRLGAAPAVIPRSEYGRRVAPLRAAPAATPAVGTTRNWLALDDRDNDFVTTPFTLLASGEHIEVWVAADLSFPAGDCRNDVEGGARVVVTQAQAAQLAATFDRLIYPRESAAFSVPRERDGTRARADGARYSPTGDGDDIVVLVENVRDENFYDTDNAGNQPYIAGFFASELVDFFDRNVLTLDAYDWLHRTGATPPHQPVPGDLCQSAPARPFLYESTFAHEYQHLLEHYEDPNEVTWADEGLADLAMQITGFVDPRRTIEQTGYDSHIQCFLGWIGVQTSANPNPQPGGPENSLTLWNEHSADEVLCDYGAAFSFMEFLSGRYGLRFISQLHRDNAAGLDGLRSVMRRLHVHGTAGGLIRDWAATMALDAVLDRGAPFSGRRASYRTPTLRGEINWDTRLAYARAGAPPNGSDFVRLRDGHGRFLRAGALRSLAFRGERAAGFGVRLVAYSSSGKRRAYLAGVPLSAGRGTLGRSALRRLVGRRADVVAAIVTSVDPTERERSYPRYRLTVNGVVQPGG